MKIEILCHSCKQVTEKELRYLKRRIKEGKTLFFCSRKCADVNHSKLMSNEGNPNYNGKFHGQCPSTWSTEKRLKASIKVSETMIERGTSKGANNGRWRGGQKPVNCTICAKPYTVSPYVFDLIEAGKRKPCCDRNCARIYAQTQVKKARTSIEIKMAEELKRRNIEYIEQHILGNKFALDFFLPEFNIVIECDGDYWHRLPDVAKRDKSKNAYIKACGLSLYRFWESEINADVEACVDVVLAEINEKEAI
ncbi:MAG: endonuclease domain-containing protein [Bacillota bacterium]